MMDMNITDDEARDALLDVEKVSARAKGLVLADFIAFPLIFWGLIWFILQLVTFLYERFSLSILGLKLGVVWGSVCSLGMLVTCVVVMRKLKNATPTGRKSDSWLVRQRHILLIAVWIVFQFAMGPLVSFESGRDENAYYTLSWMLFYVVLGFSTLCWSLSVIGELVCLWTVAGYVFMGDYYGLWMGITAGGTLFAGGIHARNTVRRHVLSEYSD